jgi:hypothetical protein
MKAKILTLAAILMISANFANASNAVRSFKTIDIKGKIYEIQVKVENLNETFEFDTKVIFREVKQKENGQQEMLDIRPFIKPEKEVEEELF